MGATNSTSVEPFVPKIDNIRFNRNCNNNINSNSSSNSDIAISSKSKNNGINNNSSSNKAVARVHTNSNSIDGNNLHKGDYIKKQLSNLKTVGAIDYGEILNRVHTATGGGGGGGNNKSDGHQVKHLSNHSNSTQEQNNRLSGSLLVSSSPLLLASNSLELATSRQPSPYSPTRQHQEQSTDIPVIRSVTSSHQQEHQRTSPGGSISPPFCHNKREREKNPFEIDSLDSFEISKDICDDESQERGEDQEDKRTTGPGGPAGPVNRLDSLVSRNSLKSADLQPWTLDPGSDLFGYSSPSPQPASAAFGHLDSRPCSSSLFPLNVKESSRLSPVTKGTSTFTWMEGENGDGQKVHPNSKVRRMESQVSGEMDTDNDNGEEEAIRDPKQLADAALSELDQLLSREAEQSSLNEQLNLPVNQHQPHPSKSNASFISVTETGSGSFTAGSRVHLGSSSLAAGSTYNLINRKRGSNIDAKSVNSVSTREDTSQVFSLSLSLSS